MIEREQNCTNGAKRTFHGKETHKRHRKRWGNKLTATLRENRRKPSMKVEK